MSTVHLWPRRVVESQLARPLILIVLIFVLWDLVIRVFKIPPYLIPAPWDVAKMLVAEWPRLWRESLVTGYATLGGFGLSILFGIPVAMLIAYSRLVESYVYPLLVFSQSVPKIAIAPLFVVWFGIGIFPKIVSAFLLGFFPVVVATVMGFKSMEPEMIDLARSMRASRLQMFVKFSLPQALPSIFSGLKVSATLAGFGAGVGGIVSSEPGHRHVFQNFHSQLPFPPLFAPPCR